MNDKQRAREAETLIKMDKELDKMIADDARGSYEYSFGYSKGVENTLAELMEIRYELGLVNDTSLAMVFDKYRERRKK